MKWKSVDEALRDLRADIPAFEAILHYTKHDAPENLARYGLTPHDVEQLEKVVGLLHDECATRARLEAIAEPDGSVQLSITPETLALLGTFGTGE